ncbi:MAG: Hsp20/alpha crystallin family protein [Halobacteriaceae archaeon]
MGTGVLKRLGRVASKVREKRSIDADLLENSDEYLAIFDTPGARASDITVRYKSNAIEIRVDRFRTERDTFEMRYPGRGLRLDGKVTLPPSATVNPEGASAVFKDDGTLWVHLPKSESESESGSE